MLKQLQSKNSMTFIFLLYHYFTFLSRILIAYIYPSTGAKTNAKENSLKKQAEKKDVDDALITAVLSCVDEIGVRKAAAEAGIAWQTVNKWMKEKELTTPDDIKEAVEGVAAMFEKLHQEGTRDDIR